MRRPLVTIAIAASSAAFTASLAAVAAPMATSAADADDVATGPSTTDAKPIDTGTPSSVDPSEFDPEGLVGAARAGLGDFAANYIAIGSDEQYDLAECPLITPTDLLAAVASFGDAGHLEYEFRSTIEVDTADDVADGEPVDVFVTCDTEDYTEDNLEAIGPVYGVGIGVFDYSATAESLDELADFVSGSPGGVIVEPSLDTLGGTLYGYCEEDDDSLPAGSAGCYQFWISGELAVGMFVVSDASEPDALAQLEAVVLDQLPPLLQRIADGITPVEVVTSDEDDDVAVTATVPS